MAQQQDQQELQVQLSPEVAVGNYANLSIVSHTDSEFVMDFAFIQPGQPSAVVTSRVVLGPQQAKRLALTLSNGVVRFEETFGEIALALPGQEEK